MTSSSSTTIVLISGANGGIGFATAKLLAARNPKDVIILGSRDPSSGTAAVTKLKAEGHQSVSWIQLDVTSDTSISLAAEKIQNQYGRLDVLINNAGVMLGLTSTTSIRTEFENTLAVNLTGTACLTQEMLPLLKLSKLPRVVFVLSALGSIATATDSSDATYSVNLAAYRASKAGLNMLAATYSMLLAGYNGKINTVCPGLVSTGLNGFNPHGSTPEEGAEIVIKMATLDKDGPTATFTNIAGPLPW